MLSESCRLVPLLPLLFVAIAAGADRSDLRYRDMDLMFQLDGVDAFKTLHLRFDGVEDLELFMQTYYVNPRPDLISSAIKSLPKSAFVKRPNNDGGAVAFFSEVFTANSAMMPKWKREISKLDKTTKAILENAIMVSSKGGVLKLGDQHSPAMNDMYWAAFFASGNKAYVDRLIEEFKNFDERKDQNLFMSGGSAMWSAASNAKRHHVVKAKLEEAKTAAEDRRMRELIERVLALARTDSNPDAFNDELRAIIQKQHEAGVW